MARPVIGTHARLKAAKLALVRAQYPDVTVDQLWRVEHINGGYGREALHLVAIEGGYTAEVAPDARRIVVWRGHVQGEPRCEYCQAEGHANSTGTAAVCKVRADEVAAQRKAASERMKAWHAARRAFDENGEKKVPF